MAKVIGKTLEAQQFDTKSEEERSRLLKASEQQKTSFLPQRVRVEEEIQKRPDALSELKKDYSKNVEADNLKQRIIGNAAKAGKLALDSLQLVDERIQGAIAGPLYEMQDLSQESVASDAVFAALHGIQGKRKVRFQDVMLSAMPEMKIGEVDVSKPLAVIGGIGAELGVGSKLVGAAQNALRGGKGTLKSIEKSYEVAKKVKDASGKALAKLFDSGVGKKTINPLMRIPLIDDPSKSKSLLEVINGLPKGTMKNILSDPNTFEVVGNISKNGVVSIDTSAKNLWNLRKALDDLITEGEFAKGATKIAKSRIMDSANMLRRVLSSVDKKVASLMDQYSEYSRVFGRVSEILTTKGRVVANKAATVLKRNGEPEAQMALQEFASLFPRGAKMLKDIKVLNRNRAVTMAAELALKASVGAAIFSKFIRRPISEEIGPENKAGSGGG